MTPRLQKLFDALTSEGFAPVERLGELTIEVAAGAYEADCRRLRDAPTLKFEQLIDLCGLDYAGYGDQVRQDRRFAAVLHLLSVAHNARVRVRCFCPDDALPLLPTVTELWPAADWYEREAFDLFGIVFDGHPDLRRLLTDYGFIGHPFRKDFPLSGYVEMRYDPEQRRVVYQPVSIEPREVTPRIVRVEHYAEEK